ncbi:Cilia-and flagella-associated protein 298 [Lotmaria passim]
MVLLECKRLPKEEYSKDYDAFIASVPATTNIGDATDAMQRMQNTRVRLTWMMAAARQMLKDHMVDEAQQHYFSGPIGDTERYLSLERTERRQLCTQEELDALVEAFKGGAMILFPAECSGNDACRRLAAVLDDDAASDVEKSKAHRLLSIIDDGASNENILSGKAVLWWSAKPLARDADFAKYIGKNEKTKITVKLAPDGGAAPPREPAVDAKAQAELMQHYYRKQEEMKKLVEDEDISFGNSEWANPHGLKNQLQGIDSVRYRASF